MRGSEFDGLLDWLYQRLGRQVSVSMQCSGGNVHLHARGGVIVDGGSGPP
jgi:hypothetical protein